MIKIIAIILLLFIQTSCATSGADAVLYKNAVNNIKSDRLDFAFLDLKELVSSYPESVYVQRATLSLAEYYFNTANYSDATDTLLKYINNFPDDKNIIFAQGFLYKIMTNLKIDNDEKYIEVYNKLREHFFSKSLFLMFSTSKTKVFISALNNRYSVKEYIDKIEILKNDEPFLRILP